MRRHNPNTHRQAQRARVDARTHVAITTPCSDPLVHSRFNTQQAAREALLYTVSAFGLHGALMLSMLALNVLLALETLKPLPASRIEVTLQETPPPEPIGNPEALQSPANAKPTQPEPKPDPAKIPPKPKPKPKQNPIADAPPKPTTTPPPRRVVGLAMESTVEGGAGPAFAIGNTRMGTTADVAEDPNSVRNVANAERLNEQASTQLSGRYTLPKMLEQVIPEYPDLLRRQGVEADVVVLIKLDDTGQVVDSRIFKASRYDTLNDAALDAARRQKFLPATRDGVPVAYTLRYTYRFRLDE